MGVVQIWKVWVGMDQALVPMGVSMRFPRRVIGSVLVLVVLIMPMHMTMLSWVVTVFMLMVLCQVQPYTGAHQQGGSQELEGKRLSTHRQCQQRAHEGGQGKVGAGASSPDLP